MSLLRRYVVVSEAGLHLLRGGCRLGNQSERGMYDVLIQSHQPGLILIDFHVVGLSVHVRCTGTLNDRFKSQLTADDPKDSAA